MHPSHVGQVGFIERASFSTPWPDKFFHAHILHPCGMPMVAMALPSQRIIGYLILWRENSKQTVQIQNLAVHQDYRGQGVGRLLMLAGLRRAAEIGFKRATLEVRPSNTHALELYRSLGFVHTGVRPGYYQPENEEALVMACDLDALGSSGVHESNRQ